MTPNDLGEKYLVEECQRINISDFLKSHRSNLKQLVLKTELEVIGIKVLLGTSKTGFNGFRFWFICPLCLKKMGVLFIHPINHLIGCRHCLNLEYRKRRFKGMIEEKS